MNVPSGYSALDLVGFTDKGDYSASTNYVKNDLVHYDDKIWKCLIDDTTAIEPTEGVNWTLWIQQSNSLDGLADVEITNAQDGQEITYDGTTQKWKNTSKFQTLTNQVKDMNNVLGAKNLLPNNATSQVINGITCTVNDDGSIRLTGTATNVVYIDLLVDLTDGVTYTASGISGGSATTYQIHLQTADGASTNAGSFVNGEKTFTKNSGQASPNNYDVHRYRIKVSSGATVDTVIYPMIRLASIEDNTYVPYAKSNRELTENVKELTVTTGQIARLVSFSSITAYYARKYGKVVELYFAGTLSEAVNRWTTFLTVPDGFRPSHYVQIVSFNTYNSCKNLQLAPTGDIQPGDNLAIDDFIRFTVTYIID